MKNSVVHVSCSRRGLLAACAVVLGLAFAGTAEAAEVIITTRPPAMRYEPLPPPPPGPPLSWTWLPGHWVWNGRGYVWVPGYYVRRPPRYVGWVPGRWVLRRRGWVWVDGYWRR